MNPIDKALWIKGYISGMKMNRQNKPSCYRDDKKNRMIYHVEVKDLPFDLGYFTARVANAQ